MNKNLRVIILACLICSAMSACSLRRQSTEQDGLTELQSKAKESVKQDVSNIIDKGVQKAAQDIAEDAKNNDAASDKEKTAARPVKTAEEITVEEIMDDENNGYDIIADIIKNYFNIEMSVPSDDSIE